MLGQLIRNLFLTVSFAFAASCASALAPNVNTEPRALKPGNYALDRDHAALIFKVGHLGFSKYVGRFERFDVSLNFNEGNPESAEIEAVVDMTSLDVANDPFANILMGPNWFDANQFPETIFRATGVEITGDNTGVMKGDLTMHGVTQPSAMTVTFNGGGFDRLRGAYVIGMSAHTTVSRRSFGVKRFGILVSDNVELEIEAEFKKR